MDSLISDFLFTIERHIRSIRSNKIDITIRTDKISKRGNIHSRLEDSFVIMELFKMIINCIQMSITSSKKEKEKNHK